MGIGYTYDSAGRLSTATYPTIPFYSTPPTYTYGYDGMGRPASMTDNTTNPYTGLGVPWVQNGTYDRAGHMTSMTVFSGNTVTDNPAAYWAATAQTMGYNVNGQLTSMNWAYVAHCRPPRLHHCRRRPGDRHKSSVPVHGDRCR